MVENVHFTLALLCYIVWWVCYATNGGKISDIDKSID